MRRKVEKPSVALPSCVLHVANDDLSAEVWGGQEPGLNVLSTSQAGCERKADLVERAEVWPGVNICEESVDRWPWKLKCKYTSFKVCPQLTPNRRAEIDLTNECGLKGPKGEKTEHK